MPAVAPADDLSAWAQHYARTGLMIFPVNPEDKTPLISQYEATSDPAKLAAWWRMYPTALIGCRLNPGTVILDIDPRHNGHQTWARLLDELGLDEPAGRSHVSGRGDGGRHYWFTHGPLGDDVRLRITRLNQWAQERQVGAPTKNGNRWTCGIDVLHHTHRYTILPPSPHPSTGRPYAWVAEGDPAPIPSALLELITKPKDLPLPPATRLRPVVDTDSIADWFSSQASWNDILGDAGWICVAGDGDSDGSRWRHPGSTSKQPSSIRHGCLFVYSPNTEFEPTEEGDARGYTRFRAWAILEHSGDLKRAAAAAFEMRDGPTEPIDWSYLRVEPAPAEPWPDPRPIELVVSEPVVLDHRAVLPPVAADLVDHLAESLQIPTCAVAHAVLGALSVVACGRVNARINAAWAEPAHIQGAVALPSGRAKSPLVAKVFAPVRAAETRHRDRTDDEVSRLIHRRKVAEKRAAELDKLGSSAMDDPMIEAERIALARQLAGPPLEPFQLLVQDATPEALGELLWIHDGRMCVVSPEPELLNTALGAQSGKSEKTSLEVYLKGADGDWHDIRRKGGRDTGRTSIRLPRVCVAVFVATQPGILDRVRSDDTLNDRGFVARLMIVKPTLRRLDLSARLTPRDAEPERAWADLVAGLAERWWRYAAPADVQISAAAAAEHARWGQPIADRWDDGDLDRMGGFVAKLLASTMRTAVLLHIADGRGHDEEVDVATMRRACAVGDWWLDHAIHLWQPPESVLTIEQEMAVRLAERVRGEGLAEFTQRDAYRLLRSAFSRRLGGMSADDAAAALDAGEALGWWRSDGRIRNTTRTVTVNPGIATLSDLVARVARTSYRRGFELTPPSSPLSPSFTKSARHARQSDEPQPEPATATVEPTPAPVVPADAEPTPPRVVSAAEELGLL